MRKKPRGKLGTSATYPKSLFSHCVALLSTRGVLPLALDLKFSLFAAWPRILDLGKLLALLSAERVRLCVDLSS